MKTAWVFRLVLVSLALVRIGISAEVNPSAPSTLEACLKELKSRPEGDIGADFPLRLKIIKLVLESKTAPEVPESAERNMAYGMEQFKTASSPASLILAVKSFEKVARDAPWLPAAYYNLGMAYEQLGQFERAIQSFRTYLLAAPGSSDSKEVRNGIYGLELKATRKWRGAAGNWGDNRGLVVALERDPSTPGKVVRMVRPGESYLADISGMGEGDGVQWLDEKYMKDGGGRDGIVEFWSLVKGSPWRLNFKLKLSADGESLEGEKWFEKGSDFSNDKVVRPRFSCVLRRVDGWPERILDGDVTSVWNILRWYVPGEKGYYVASETDGEVTLTKDDGTVFLKGSRLGNFLWIRGVSGEHRKPRYGFFRQGGLVAKQRLEVEGWAIGAEQSGSRVTFYSDSKFREAPKFDANGLNSDY